MTVITKYGKRGETGNLKKLALEVEHEIESEFIWIKCIEWNKMLHFNNTYVYAQYTCRLVWNKNDMLSEIV